MTWFGKFFSAEFSESSKRLILVSLVITFVVQFFLIMYIKVEIANQKLVDKNIWYLVILIGVFGGYVTTELITKYFSRKAELQADVDSTKAKAGIQEPVVNENVETQNVSAAKTVKNGNTKTTRGKG